MKMLRCTTTVNVRMEIGTITRQCKRRGTDQNSLDQRPVCSTHYYPESQRYTGQDFQEYLGGKEAQ